MSSIDALLHRTLRSGSQFEGLIPPYQGSEHNFDKETDNSNTYDTLRFMAQWSNKYAYQMKRIAPLLKGATIQETVNNIYQFLYSHFQYKLDGSLQNLYSPSAAWHFRKSGFDCKTYSLLASILLQNLKIPHSFRMVQQLGIMPGEWSHVYVIVPDKNIEYVIDATTHNNKQVSFTKKHDYVMKHLGLASPYTSGLGCACQGTPITNKGLGAPGNLETTIANFHVFLNELEKKGFPKATTDKMLALVRYNVENGIDPNMQEIVKKALLPAGQLGLDISQITSFLQPAGTTYGNAPISNMAIQGTSISGMSSLISVGIDAAATAFPPLALLKLIPIEKTFGQVFANGFDLSCWGASYSEQKAKLDLEKDVPFMAQWSGLDRVASTETYDRFLNITEAYLMDAKNGQQSKYAACTRKGHALRQKTIEELRINTANSFAQNGYKLVPNGTRRNQLTIQGGLPGYAAGNTFGNPPYQTNYAGYIVVQPTTIPTAPTAVPTEIAYTATGIAVTPAEQIANPKEQYYNAAGKPLPPNEPAKSSSSSATPLLIGGALIALKLLI